MDAFRTTLAVQCRTTIAMLVHAPTSSACVLGQSQCITVTAVHDVHAVCYLSRAKLLHCMPATALSAGNRNKASSSTGSLAPADTVECFDEAHFCAPNGASGTAI